MAAAGLTQPGAFGVPLNIKMEDAENIIPAFLAPAGKQVRSRRGRSRAVQQC